MKKLLSYIMIAMWMLAWSLVFAEDTGTTFNVDDSFFDITSFSQNDYSTIHFGTWDTGNSFGWAIFWWPKIDKEITLKMNWESIHCKKQIRWFYINQVRGNIMWPLDNTTLWLFKWNLLWYQNLSLDWWFFTHCTWDAINNYNWIYGYVRHTTQQWLEYELWAWLNYKMGILWDNRWDSLWQEMNLSTKEFFIKWIIYDSYGGIWFINSVFNNPLIIRNNTWDSFYIDLELSPDAVNLWWNIEYTVNFGNNLDFYLDDVKVYITIPSNIDANWYEIWDLSENKLLIYDGDLYPLQSKKFTFRWIAVKSGEILTTWNITAWLVSHESFATGFVVDTRFGIGQNSSVKDYVMIWDRVTFDITIYNSGNMTDTWVILLDYLPDWFIFNNAWFERYGDAIILFSGELEPWQQFNIKLKWYFDQWWNFKNTVKVRWNNFDTINNSINVEIKTHICGDGILEEAYEFCDDWENNGSIWYCNDKCTKIIWAGVACKYTDANYLANWPFMDTLNHRWYDYIEIMRKSCLHRWKWTFASQWKYDPNEYVTKAEVLKTLVKIRGIAFEDFNIINEDQPYDGVQVFADVPKNHWFSRYSFYAFDHWMADWLFAQKWNNRYLYPDSTITRNQMIKAIMTLYKEVIDSSDIDISGDSKLADIAIWSSYYYQYVREAEELWIISWYDMPNGKKMWLGNNPLTRAEFAKIVSIPFAELLFEKN